MLTATSRAESKAGDAADPSRVTTTLWMNSGLLMTARLKAGAVRATAHRGSHDATFEPSPDRRAR